MIRATTKAQRHEKIGKLLENLFVFTAAYPNANYDTILDFPPKSADLNIIENILDDLSYRCVWRKGAIPATLN